MAQTVKFSLPVNNKGVLDLNELRENFELEAMITLFRNGLLQHWLECFGYTAELEQLKAVAETASTREIADSLIRIFKVELDIRKLEQCVLQLDLRNERQQLLNDYKQKNLKGSELVAAEKRRYFQIIDEISNHKDDVELIRSHLKELTEHHYEFVLIDFVRLFSFFPVAMGVFFLGNERLRPLFLYNLNNKDEAVKAAMIRYCACSNNNYQSSNMFKFDEQYCLFNFLKYFRDCAKSQYLTVFQGDTKGYWKDLESQDTRCMLIAFESGRSDDCVRSHGQRDKSLRSDDINGKYPILNGLDVCANYNVEISYFVM